MMWRRLVPVASPVSPSALAAASAASIGLRRSPHDAVAARLSATFAAPEILLTASGTAALILALRAVASPGSIVAMPGYACIDIIAAAIGAGVRVTLYDLDPATLSPDPASVTAALRRGSRALVVAPLYGYPQDIPALMGVAAEHGVAVVEDAAQGAGGTLHGTPLGSFGDLSVLSFGRGKGMTSGSGGALLARSPDLLEWAGATRLALGAPARGVHAIAALAAQWMLARPNLYRLPASIPFLALGEMVYHPPREPAALSVAGATILDAAMQMNPAEVAARQRNAAALSGAMGSSSKLAAIRPIVGAGPGYLRLAGGDLNAGAVPDPRLGILRGYPVTLDEHPATRRVLAPEQPALPGARALRDSLFTLPTHSGLKGRDLDDLRRWLGDAAA